MTRRRLPVVLCLALAVPALLAAQQARPGFFGVPTSSAVFDDSQMRDVRLVMSSRDWNTLKANYLENTYYPADFYWQGHILRNAAIRSRGTGSRSPVKPGLKVSFDRYVTGQAFLGLSSLVLRNNTQDASNMHERLSMQLFARLNLPAPRESYARLFVNDEYLGVYTIVESIDDRFLQRYFPATNGYLFSFDYPANAPPFYFENRGADPALYVPQPFKPENHESDPRADVIVQMVQAVNLSSDATFRSASDRYVDVAATVRQAAVESFLVDDDGLLGNWGMNNVYLYRLPDSQRFTFLAWDKSDAFMAGSGASIWHGVTDVPDAQRNRLIDRALAYPDLRALYLDTLVECARVSDETDPASGDGAGWLERQIQRQYDQIREAARADDKKPFSNDEFEQSVQALHGFAATRGDEVRRQVARARATGQSTTAQESSERRDDGRSRWDDSAHWP